MIVKNKKDIEFVKKNFNQVQHKLLNKNSAAESHFESLLISSGLYFRREKGNYKTQTRWSYFDFYLPYYHLYIEIDGISHNSEEQKNIDAQKEKIVKNKQRRLLRLSNEYVLSLSSINIDDLLTMQFKQEASKRKRGGYIKSRNRYWRHLNTQRQHGIEDMNYDADFDIDENQEVWLYDNSIGNYFRFENIYEEKFSTELSVNQIHELCETKEYKKSWSRRFVFAYTKNDCELRVLQTYS